MRVTRVNMKKLKNAGCIKAIASIVLDEAICLKQIEVVEGREGELFIAFPKFRNMQRKFYNVAHPIDNELRKKIQSAVLEEYKEMDTRDRQ